MALDRFTGENSIIFAKTEQLFDWGRSHSLWYLSFGIACCAIEAPMAASGPRYDLDRFGIFPRATPRHADLMIVAGTVNQKMAPVIKRLYEQMPTPKWVMSMGACACTGGTFRDYPNVVLGVDQVVPVDVYVPGCPPRPESVIEGLNLLREKIKRTEERLGIERRKDI